MIDFSKSEESLLVTDVLVLQGWEYSSIIFLAFLKETVSKIQSLAGWPIKRGKGMNKVGCLVMFCGISTLAGYLTLNPVYTYILNIFDL